MLGKPCLIDPIKHELSCKILYRIMHMHVCCCCCWFIVCCYSNSVCEEGGGGALTLGPGSDPGFLEKGVYMYKSVGVSLCWFYLILKIPWKWNNLVSPRPYCFHFHRIFKNGGRGFETVLLSTHNMLWLRKNKIDFQKRTFIWRPDNSIIDINFFVYSKHMSDRFMFRFFIAHSVGKYDL